jgi:hypothetical protein
LEGSSSSPAGMGTLDNGRMGLNATVVTAGDKSTGCTSSLPGKSGTEAMHAAAAIFVEPSRKKGKLERRKSLQT